jgi:cell wall-associated NlpC family hydrolase
VRDGQRRLLANVPVLVHLRRLRAAGTPATGGQQQPGTGSASSQGQGRPDSGAASSRGRTRRVLLRGRRHLRAGLWAAVALGVVASLSSTFIVHAGHSAPSGLAAPKRPGGSAGRTAPASQPGSPAADYSTALGIIRNLQAAQEGNAVAEANAALLQTGQTEDKVAQEAGVFIPAGAASPQAIPVAELTGLHAGPHLGPPGRLRPADLFVAAPKTLPAGAIASVRKLAGVASASVLDAARVKINGGYAAVLGVHAAAFREYAASPTADATALWQNVADGAIAVSYLMGKQEKLPLGGTVQVAGARTEKLLVGGFGTVGISGVDAVVSDQVARSLGMPAGNALVISAPKARLATLMTQIRKVLPAGASVTPLVAQAAERGSAGSAGAVSVSAAGGQGLTVLQTRAFLTAALSRLGKPYVWGGSGPDVFDCSGLVQWSMAQAGIVMPRVAVDQAQTGPLIPLSDLQPGDLLFYHTDPTAPTYISHVAIYLGKGLMLQAPQPGMDVEIVPAVFGSGFAGAVQVYPRVAASVAAGLAG